MNNELLPNTKDDNIKLIAIKEGSPSTTSEDLILIPNYDSSDVRNELNSDDLTDEYVLFASNVMDYIDKDNYMVSTSKSSSTELQLSITSNLTRKEEVSQQQFTQTNEDTESTRGSSEINEIEYVLLPSTTTTHEEKLKPESNYKSLANSATCLQSTESVDRAHISNIAQNRNLKISNQEGVVSNVTVSPSVRNQPVILTSTKKLMSEVTQTTAKVSIGNTTISVPLLKPLNTSQMPTTSLFTEANNRAQQPLTKLQKPPQQQKQQLNLRKILNVKRTCPKLNQPTIVSLSQLQVKPVSTAKIVQAKLVGNKMQLQIPNTVSVPNLSPTTSSAGLVTTNTAARPKANVLQNVSFIKSPTKKELVSTAPSDDSSINVTGTGINVHEQLHNSIDNIASSVSSTIAKTNSLKESQSEIRTTTSTIKRNESTTTSTSTNLKCMKTNLNPTCTTTVKKILASASMHNSPPLLMPLCKQNEQHQLQSLVSAKRSLIGSTVSIIKQNPQNSQQLITITGGGNSSATPMSVASSDLRSSNDTYDVLNTKSQSLTHGPTEIVNKKSGAALITVPRNISVLLTKNDSNQQMKSTFGNNVTTSMNSHLTNQTEQLAKKLNICRSGSLNITAVTLPQSLPSAIISNATGKTTENVTTKSTIVAVSVPVSQSIVQNVESNFSSSSTLMPKQIKVPSSSTAISLFGVQNVKRLRVADTDVDPEEILQSAPVQTKRPSIDINATKNTEVISNKNLIESTNRTNKESMVSNEKTADVKTSTQTQSVCSLRQEDTHNVLLKQLLQNTSNATTVTTKSPSPPVCNQVLSARKVINVRAPSLGLVSSLEAQLARPVIPPVPASTTTQIKTETSSPKTSLPKVNCTENEKFNSNINDAKQKPSVQIISKETSFVSSPSLAVNKPQVLANGVSVRSHLTDQTTSSVSTTLNTSSTGISRFVETSINSNQSSGITQSEHIAHVSDKSTSILPKTLPESKLDLAKLSRNENATTPNNNQQTQAIITTSMTSNLGVTPSTNTHSNIFVQQRNVLPEIATPESSLVENKNSNNRINSKTPVETPSTSLKTNLNANKEKLSIQHSDPPDAHIGGSMHVNIISKIQQFPNKTSTADVSPTAELLQRQSSENLFTNTANSKLAPVKDQVKDAEMRKKRKRDYQKHRRQLNSNKESASSATVLSPLTSGGSTCKKRPRKLLKMEEDYDNFNENLMSHIRQMQPLQVLEPVLSHNYNSWKMYGKCHANKESNAGYLNEDLMGEFGSAKLSQIEGLYEKRYLSNKEKDDKSKALTIQNYFYDQEFLPIISGSEQEKINRFLGTMRERQVEALDVICNKNSNIFSNATDSQHLSKWNTFASLSYPGLILRHSGSSQTLGRMSPVIPLVEPNSHSPRTLPLRFLSEESKKSLPEEKPSVNILKIKRETPDGFVNSQTVVLSLAPFVVNNVLGVLKDLANLLNIATPTNFKVIDSTDSNQQNKICSLPQKLTNVFKKATLQQVLNGRSKICAKCGRTIEADGIRCSKKAFENCISSILVMPLSECYIYFCSRLCYTNARYRTEKPAFNQKFSMPASSAGQTRLFPLLKIENSSIAEKVVKKRRFKYFSSKCFTPTLPVKHPSEKEMVDILFRMDITVSANNVIKSLSGSPIVRPIEDTRCCVLCGQHGDGVPDGPSRLLNFDIDKYVHLNCALWSNGVYETISGGLVNLNAAIQASLNQYCTACQQLGATVKCFKNRCSTVYHLSCALKNYCIFYKNKTIHCQQHASKTEKENELTSLSVYRRVFIERDENRQVAAVMHHSELSNLLRVGSLTFLNVGQLLPHQLEAFHNHNFIYPIGYKITRFYWSMKRPNKRCRYICSIVDASGKPEFRIQVQETNENDIELQDITPNGVWQKVLEAIAILRRNNELVQLFPRHVTGEDLFGLTEPAIVRIIESLPGVESLTDYRFKYGRNPLLELPLALNPSGAARTEPKQKQIVGWRKPHTQRSGTSSNQRVANSVVSVFTGEVACPYSKQFVHSKSSQYKKMKQEWRNNVYLARSKIQGLGLYAARDMERHTMIIEYIGEVIRTEVSEIREKQYESRNRGIYMFRLDEERVVDATLSGGLARYINHSCNPNCVTEIVEVDRELRIIIFAKRRINRGEELSYDYKFDIEDDANKIQCMCGAPNCRKWMN